MMSMNRRRNSNSVLKRICQRLFFIILIIGIPCVLMISSFHIKDVSVIGSTRYTSEEMADKIIQTKTDSNSLLLYLKYQYFMNANIPFVEKVDVEMVDNHSITIHVYEKMVTGCVEFLGEYLYFDKDGIIVESSSKRLEDIPQIKGLQYDKIILNEKLEVQKRELFDVILNLTQLINKYELNVNTISFNSSYEVTIDCDGNKAQLGRKSTYDEVLSELKNILAVTNGKKIMIDMRNFVKGTNSINAKSIE